MQSKYEILNPDTTYHVYNRANGSEKLFRSADNYHYFLKKYQEFISPLADTFCYCLMPNHFHFLIRIKAGAELIKHFEAAPGQSATLQGFKTLEGLAAKQAPLPKLLSQQFSHFFNGYTQAFNKMYKRKGALFMHPFKRKKIEDEKYLKQLVQYIHLNPTEAFLCNNPADWPYSSYSPILSQRPSFLERNELIGWFEDEDNFRLFHSQHNHP